MKFSLSGLWKGVGSSVIAAGVLVAPHLLAYLNTVTLPGWAHQVVGVAGTLLALYEGKTSTSA